MIEPTQIIEEDNGSLSISWSDGAETSYTASQLRKVCPCAGCVNEWTGERTLDQASINDDLSFSSMSIVGRYALSFTFSDEHDTGIFSFEFLRKIPGT